MKKMTVQAAWCILLISFMSGIACAEEFGIEIYAKRRQALMDSVKSGMIILKNSGLSPRSGDDNYFPYRVNSDFYYLTGLEDPDAVMLLLPEPDVKYILFVKPKNAIDAAWNGEVPGIEGAMRIFGADTAFALDEFEKQVQGYLFRNRTLYYDLYSKQAQALVQSLLNKTYGYGPKELADIRPWIKKMRLIKDAEEIRRIRKAVDITSEAHIEVMKAVEPGMAEYEIGAMFNYLFQKNGASGPAYESIVASGPNATIFHYPAGNRRTQIGDLVMMDVGAEYMNYTSDVTRVIPVSGKFSAPQKELYELALSMEEAIIAGMKPGANLGECLNRSRMIAKEGLHKLGLITDKESPWQYLLYYLPYEGHQIGLDVHDVGGYGYDRIVLKPGMVYAIEPLIYVGENQIESFRSQAVNYFQVSEKEVDDFLGAIRPAFEKYKTIAARVEDDVLITETGHEVLSAKVPKTVKDIEKMMANKSYLNSK